MRVRGIVFEDFVNYKKPSMFLVTCACDWKCCSEAGISHDVCQNAPLIKSEIREFSDETIYKAYINNNISRAVVIGGLEPMLQINEVIGLIRKFRDCGRTDDIVVYTGYTEQECKDNGWLDALSGFENIIVKFGRYIPNQQPHFDPVLGVNLASDNQYAKVIGAST